MSQAEYRAGQIVIVFVGIVMVALILWSGDLRIRSFVQERQQAPAPAVKVAK